MRRNVQGTSTRLLIGAIATIILVVLVFSTLLAQLRPPPLVILAPPLDAVTSLRFLAVGRQGYGNPMSSKIANAMEHAAAEMPTHAVLILGDNFYPVGVASVDDSQWDKKFERLYSGSHLRGMPFFAVLGNHDHQGDEMAEVEYARMRMGTARWQMDNLYYTRDFGRVDGRVLARVVFLDTITMADEPEQQLDFAARAFEAAGDPIWRVVAGHYPIRSETREEQTQKRIMSRLLPRFQSMNVDLYLSANDRFQQILDRPGEPLHVSTNGGSDKQEVGLKPEEPARDVVLSEPGFAVVTFDDEHLTVELRDATGKLTATRKRTH